ASNETVGNALCGAASDGSSLRNRAAFATAQRRQPALCELLELPVVAADHHLVINLGNARLAFRLGLLGFGEVTGRLARPLLGGGCIFLANDRNAFHAGATAG